MDPYDHTFLDYSVLHEFIPLCLLLQIYSTFWAVQIAPHTRWMMVGAQISWRLMFWEDEKNWVFKIKIKINLSSREKRRKFKMGFFFSKNLGKNTKEIFKMGSSLKFLVRTLRRFKMGSFLKNLG
jgi:hypothetical protein